MVLSPIRSLPFKYPAILPTETMVMGERVCDFHATNRSGLLEGPTPVFDCATSSETCSLHERSERPAAGAEKDGEADRILSFIKIPATTPQQLLHKFRVQVVFVFSSSLTEPFPPQTNQQEIHFSPVFCRKYSETHLCGILESIHLWRWLVRCNFFAHFLQVPLLWVEQGFLVGGFNPFEKYSSKWESSPIFGVNKRT